MHVALIGPIAGSYIADLLPHVERLPAGYSGAPFMGQLVRALLSNGHRVTAITTDSTLPLRGEPVRHTAGDFAFVACPSRPRAWRPNGLYPGRALDLFRFEIRALAAELCRVKADVIHAHWSYEFALAALAVDEESLITCHDAPIQILKYTKSPYRLMRLLMALRVFKRGRYFTAVSSYMAEQLKRHHDVAAEVIPNPISKNLLSAGAVRIEPRGRRVLMVNNGWDDRKNVAAGVAAFLRWAQNHPDAQLHLFGNGYAPGDIAARELARAGTLAPSVFMRGPVSHDFLMQEMATSDCLLHTALEESFGVVLAEAMALGLPVVAGSKSGAVPWVLGLNSRSPSGVGVDVASIESISAGLDVLFGQDYGAYSSAGRNRVRQLFLADSVVGQYLEIYKRRVN